MEWLCGGWEAGEDAMPGASIAGRIGTAGTEGLRHLPNYPSSELKAINIILVL